MLFPILRKFQYASIQNHPRSLDLKYNFDFIIEELTAEGIIINEQDYEYDKDEKILTLKNEWSPYSGVLKADIQYQAFNWESDYISTLEPIVFNFSGIPQLGQNF